MNDRHKRVMRNMHRDDIRLWWARRMSESFKTASISAVDSPSWFRLNAHRKPIKWHKSNKRW